MKLKSVLVWTALTFVSVVAINVTSAETQPYPIPGRYVVVLKHGHTPSGVANTHGLKPDRFYSDALNGFAGAVPEGRLHALRNDPRVEFLEPDLQFVTTAQTISTGIRRIGADRSGAARINGVDERVNADIAILDTGIAPHPDLNIFRSTSFISGQSTDGNGHGTHVAGIAAALDNDFGVVGVAPGARLWSVKVIDDSGLSTTSWAIQGIDYVTQNANQIEVANLSFTGIGYSEAMRLAISNSVARGVVYVVSAGNDARDIFGPDGVFNTPDDSIPAAYPEVMAVSALSDTDGMADGDDALADFSNYSRSAAPGNPVASPGAAIDLAAPGVNILSTFLGGGYATGSGTSQAAPHVAGAVALYVATNGRATNAAGVAAIRQALINSAQPQTAWGSVATLDPDTNPEGLVNVSGIGLSLNNPPSTVITSPANGTTFAFGSTISFQGSANDAEDGNRTSSLVWTSSIDGQIGTGGSFSRVLSAGTHTITATATDSGGKTSSASISATVQSFNNPPAVVITGPETGYSCVSGATVLFTGAAIDAEDGDRTAGIVWKSNLDGNLGTGGTVYKTLSVGSHTITATTTDSGGKSASDTITVVVQPVATPTLRVTVTTDKPAYVNRNKVYLTATVTDGVNPMPGASVYLDLTRPNGTRYSTESTTDTSGVARFQYTINTKRDGIGVFTATVSATRTGDNSGTAAITFTVTR